jgi:hypothetical protein
MTDLNLPPHNPLTTLRQDLRTHWRKYRPQMTARLEADGTLDERIEAAAKETEEAVLSYVEKAHGTSFTPAQAFWQAWEIYREEWAFLPAEASDEDEEDDDSFAAIQRRLNAIEQAYYELDDEEEADGDEA